MARNSAGFFPTTTPATTAIAPPAPVGSLPPNFFWSCHATANAHWGTCVGVGRRVEVLAARRHHRRAARGATGGVANDQPWSQRIGSADHARVLPEICREVCKDSGGDAAQATKHCLDDRPVRLGQHALGERLCLRLVLLPSLWTDP